MLVNIVDFVINNPYLRQSHFVMVQSPFIIALSPFIFQQFTFVGFTSDVLEIEVKDRFARSRPSISRILGKRKIQLSSLMHEKDLR